MWHNQEAEVFWFCFGFGFTVENFAHTHLCSDFPKVSLECNISLPQVVISVMYWEMGLCSRRGQYMKEVHQKSQVTTFKWTVVARSLFH